MAAGGKVKYLSHRQIVKCFGIEAFHFMFDLLIENIINL